MREPKQTQQIPKPLSEEARRRRLGEALNELQQSQTPESIQAWLDHIAEGRKDRPLHGREKD